MGTSSDLTKTVAYTRCYITPLAYRAHATVFSVSYLYPLPPKFKIEPDSEQKIRNRRDSGAENTRRIIDHILSCSLFAKMKKHKKCKDIVLAGDPGPVLGEGFHLYSFIGIFFLCARRFEHFPEVGKFQFGCAKSLS